jgi:hypothetical protein
MTLADGWRFVFIDEPRTVREVLEAHKLDELTVSQPTPNPLMLNVRFYRWFRASDGTLSQFGWPQAMPSPFLDTPLASLGGAAVGYKYDEVMQ